MTDPSARVDAIVEVLLAHARQDFHARAPVSDALDNIDALATGINMLAQELEGAVVSRTHLEGAYQKLKDTQTQLVQAGMLAAIGQLVSGIAHEVNNPATWAGLAMGMASKNVGRLRAMLEEGPIDEARAAQLLGEIAECLERSTDGVKRIQSIVGELRTFARAETTEDEIIVLDKVITATLHFLSPWIRDRVRVETSFAELPSIRGSSARIGQVLMNLVMNAVQALERAGRAQGRVLVSTAQADGGLVIHVDDDGPGVPEATRPRVFDPFFTTDPRGVGLGLSLAAELVAQHGGSLAVSTSPLGGARFSATFPL